MEDIWKYAAGGALIGVLGMIAGFWGKVKGVLWRVANLFVQQVEIPTEEAHNALVAYLIAQLQAVAACTTACTGPGTPTAATAGTASSPTSSTAPAA